MNERISTILAVALATPSTAQAADGKAWRDAGGTLRFTAPVVGTRCQDSNATRAIAASECFELRDAGGDR